MKISIITMQGVYNYGSALQSYATLRCFERMGHEAELINYYPIQMRNYGSIKQIYTDAKAFHGNPIKSLIIAFVKQPSMRKMKKVFAPFSSKYLNLTAEYMSNETLIENPPIADVYCTGSDQVWNNFWNSDFDKAYFLDFAPEDKKRISFAASFGRDEIDEEELAKVRPLLEKYSAVSVREDSGLRILENTEIPLKECVLDPTFMISKDEWQSLAEPIKDKGYILVYKLHEDSITSEVALEIGKKTGKQVIRISADYFKRINGGKTVVAPKVEEFLSYILNADLVVTDSFHATAFSIGLNIPFISVQWRMFNDRIGTILRKTQLEERRVTSVEQALEIYANKINFDNVNRFIADERKKTQAFLNAALK